MIEPKSTFDCAAGVYPRSFSNQHPRTNDAGFARPRSMKHAAQSISDAGDDMILNFTRHEIPWLTLAANW